MGKIELAGVVIPSIQGIPFGLSSRIAAAIGGVYRSLLGCLKTLRYAAAQLLSANGLRTAFSIEIRAIRRPNGKA
jgi:hypothetical protein